MDRTLTDTVTSRRLAQSLRDVTRDLDQLQDTALYQARRAARGADRFVRDHPYTTASIAAAGLGVALGLWLWGRDRR